MASRLCPLPTISSTPSLRALLPASMVMRADLAASTLDMHDTHKSTFEFEAPRPSSPSFPRRKQLFLRTPLSRRPRLQQPQNPKQTTSPNAPASRNLAAPSRARCRAACGREFLPLSLRPSNKRRRPLWTPARQTLGKGWLKECSRAGASLAGPMWVTPQNARTENDATSHLISSGFGRAGCIPVFCMGSGCVKDSPQSGFLAPAWLHPSCKPLIPLHTLKARTRSIAELTQKLGEL